MEVSRDEVLLVVDRLLSGDLTREDAARWAGKLHVEQMADPLVEETLDILTGIDTWQVDADMQRMGYLFGYEELLVVRPGLAESPDS